MRTYTVYILASRSRTLYIGVTGNLTGRLFEHRTKTDKDSFTARYDVNRLVYFEDYKSVRNAIAREKELKGWRRAKKVELIESMNPEWADLLPDVP